MNFDDADFALAFKPLSSEPQLVFIPVDEERGVVAVVKPFGNGQASCIAFAPATSKHTPFSNYKPSFLRKVVTTDFSIRQGNWQPLTLDANSTTTLQGAVTVLMGELERTAPENVIEIDMTRPANTSSAPDVAFATYKAGEHTPLRAEPASPHGRDAALQGKRRRGNIKPRRIDCPTAQNRRERQRSVTFSLGRLGTVDSVTRSTMTGPAVNRLREYVDHGALPLNATAVSVDGGAVFVYASQAARWSVLPMPIRFPRSFHHCKT